MQVQLLGAAIADALHYAHRHSVLHRDLKPGNVALTTEGQPKILDFGLALLLSGDAMTGSLTQAGTVMRSLAYMAPEQLAGEEEDSRTDVYALGVTLFELAAGQPPFAQERPQALMFAIVNTPAPSLRTLRPEASVDFHCLIASCLEKDRARRPAVPQHLAGSDAGLFRRRHDRGGDRGPCADHEAPTPSARHAVAARRDRSPLGAAPWRQVEARDLRPEEHAAESVMAPLS